MFQGTGSDVGKSLLVAGLCRAYSNRGLRVRPFKPQNMSNNAAVTADGKEIGRAQALQAIACRVPPSVHMNPVLLKPQTDVGAQVVVHGQVLQNATARSYRSLKPQLLPKTIASLHTLATDADLLLIEGAGSPAEVNLRAGDIANMGFAEAAGLPVVLVGDIDRGGVIAAIAGTHTVLSPADRRHLRGYVINKFRGDPSLFTPALDIIHGHTNWPCFGVIPWFAAAAKLPPEDGVALANRASLQSFDQAMRCLKVCVLTYPRIANYDDIDPLLNDPAVDVDFLHPGTAIPGDADLVILPGSKATLADLKALKAQRWDVDLYAHANRGGAILGICGGYQMLGNTIADPLGIEGPPQTCTGLGLLNVHTTMAAEKTLCAITLQTRDGHTVQGYEMHMGETTGADRNHHWFEGTTPSAPNEGISLPHRPIMGTYVHGLLHNDAFRTAFLQHLAPTYVAQLRQDQTTDTVLDDLAAHLETHMDLDALYHHIAQPLGGV
jgi:adenosylcobyric acid synthase